MTTRPRDGAKTRVFQALADALPQLPDPYNRRCSPNVVNSRLVRITRSAWWLKNYPHIGVYGVQIEYVQVLRTIREPKETSKGKWTIYLPKGGNCLDLYRHLAYLKNIENPALALHGTEWARAFLDLIKRWDKEAWPILNAEFKNNKVKSRVWSPEARERAKNRQIVPRLTPAEAQDDLVALLAEFRGKSS